MSHARLVLSSLILLGACGDPDPPDTGADQGVLQDMSSDADLMEDMAADMAADASQDMDAPDASGDMAMSGACDPGAAPFGGGDGSAQAPYLICAPAQLSALRDQVDHAHYKLASDLDLANFAWSPIPALFGDLDGGGHTIRNLRFTSTDNTLQGIGGLANYVYGATLRDLRFDGLEVSAPGSVSGVAYNFEAPERGTFRVTNVHVTNATIRATHAPGRVVSGQGLFGGVYGTAEDLSFEGTIEVSGEDALLTRGSAMVVGTLTGQAARLNASGTMTLGKSRQSGGLLGALSVDATLTDCNVNVQMSVADDTHGGLVGLMQPGARLERCSARVTITGDGQQAEHLGGAVGQAAGSRANQMIKRAVINRVTVEGEVTGHSAGGLVGNLAGGSLTNARFVGVVTSTAARNVTPGASCMVADLTRIANETGIQGAASNVLASCVATQSGSNAEIGVGGVTGDYTAIVPADLGELVWASDKTPASGFRDQSPGVRGLPEAQLKGADAFAGWPPEAWTFIPNQLPQVRLDPPLPGQ